MPSGAPPPQGMAPNRKTPGVRDEGQPLDAVCAASGDDDSADDFGDPVRRDGVPAVAGERPAGGGLSGDSGDGELSRGVAGDDGRQHRDAAGKAVHADFGAGPGDEPEPAGRHEHDAAVQLVEVDRRGGDGRADGDFAGRREPSDGPALAADVFQDEPERPGDSVHCDDERHADGVGAVRLRQHGGRAADFDSFGGFEGATCSGRSRRSG